MKQSFHIIITSIIISISSVVQALAPIKPPLITAIRLHNNETIHRLVQEGANLNEPTDDGNTPLHWAVRRSSPDIIKLLLEHGALINIRNHENVTPLEFITCEKMVIRLEHSRELAQLLLDYGADPLVPVSILCENNTALLIWAYARIHGVGEQFVKLNGYVYRYLQLLPEDTHERLEEETRTARLRMLCIKHGVHCTQDLLFKRETGMIRLP